MKRLILLSCLMILAFASKGHCFATTNVAAPISAKCTEITANAESATTSPHTPSAQASTSFISMDGYTGVFLVSGFTAIGRAQNPVLNCFGKHGSFYTILQDADGNTSITLTPTDDSTIGNNNYDGSVYWGTPSAKIDALGSESVVCTVVTAATAGTGTVPVEACTY